MNGEPVKIEIIKPLEEAYGDMKRILFQPFDLRKWFVIGFAAWLSKIGSGGYNFRYNTGSDWKADPWLQQIENQLRAIPPWILWTGLASIILLVFALTLLFAWLRARGRFIFIDCIVKNRGAIAEPWREFREQGNSYFLFALLVGLGFLIIGVIAMLPILLPIIRGATFPPLDPFLIGFIILWAVFIVLWIVAWAVVSHFMGVIMYRQGCLAPEGFRIAVSLIASYPGEITLYCLFWIVLGIAAGIISCVGILATCCIAILPYLGTVILLPVFVCLRAFGLRFIRQFGAEYDVWAGIPATLPAPLTQPPPLPT